MSERSLTTREIALARSVFGDAIDYAKVSIRNRKWAFFQPARVTMAPMGHIHFHPRGRLYCDDFCDQALHRQGLFIHEMTHVWQAQRRGKWYLVLMRHPWSRYDYSLKPGWTLERYGLEQQAEIVKHAFLLKNGAQVPGAPPLASYDGVMPFKPGNERD